MTCLWGDVFRRAADFGTSTEALMATHFRPAEFGRSAPSAPGRLARLSVSKELDRTLHMDVAPRYAGRMDSLGDDLLWRAINRPAFPTRRPALFLDRDGVIVEERHYLRDPALVSIVPGTVELIAAARAADLAVVCVTNQAGIGRGLITWEQFAAVEACIASHLAEHGACLDAVLACPYHPEGKPPYDRPHPWRKPNPGMLFEAEARLNVDLSRSLLIGDKASDLEAARAAGLPAAVHVATGHGRNERPGALALHSATFRVHAAADPRNALPFVKET